ncbi:hypothetical protein LMG18096_00382 [Ralstonia holmesii]|uniref:Transposase n=1 Tax=Ralstonia holmesii TaxID=3058602 RepID=A0ABC8Q767_9RALS|nr:hypothetical protein LMG18096_00382 [Ralstonia sp. LMG 32967]CAJ0814392.1 hypothetical protein LMG18093_02330 [Ralstonia sp. LMG 32967]
MPFLKMVPYRFGLDDVARHYRLSAVARNAL